MSNQDLRLVAMDWLNRMFTTGAERRVILGDGSHIAQFGTESAPVKSLEKLLYNIKNQEEPPQPLLQLARELLGLEDGEEYKDHGERLHVEVLANTLYSFASMCFNTAWYDCESCYGLDHNDGARGIGEQHFLKNLKPEQLQAVIGAPMRSIFPHLGKQYNAEIWCEILGIKIMDPDGWRGSRNPLWTDEISLQQFLKCVQMSTVAPTHTRCKECVKTKEDLESIQKGIARVLGK
jgi:hypothetical protein